MGLFGGLLFTWILAISQRLGERLYGEFGTVFCGSLLYGILPHFVATMVALDSIIQILRLVRLRVSIRVLAALQSGADFALPSDE